MQKFKIETKLLPLQVRTLGQQLAAMPKVGRVDIDRRRDLLTVEGDALLADVVNAAALQGIIITPL